MPITANASLAAAATAAAKYASRSDSAWTSTAIPARSIRASTSTSGSSTLREQAERHRGRAAPRRALRTSSSTARARTIAASASSGPPSASPTSRVSWRRRPRDVDLGAQLAAQVPQDEVGQVEAALVGPAQVGRQRGVADDAGEGQPPGVEREHRALRVVQHLRRRSGRPATPRAPPCASGVGSSIEVDVAGGAVRPRRARPRGRRRGPAPRCPTDVRRRPCRWACAARASSATAGAVELRRCRRRSRPRPPARGPTASRTAARAAPGTPGRRRPGAPPRGPRTRSDEVVDAERQVEIVDEPVEPPVAQHAVEVRRAGSRPPCP